MLTIARTVLSLAAIVTVGAFSFAGASHAASPPDLSGTYHCQPAPAPCLWPGQNPSIAQSGSALEIKSDQGDISAARLTSDTTISAGPTFNSIGIVRPDHSIDWSDGTKWRKK